MDCQLARYARYSFLTSTTLEFLSGLGACCLCGSLWPGKVLAKSGDQDRSRAISGLFFQFCEKIDLADPYFIG